METLIIPYMFFSILLVVTLPILSSKTEIQLEVTNFQDILYLAKYGWKGLALWFIPVLFLTEIIFLILQRYLFKNQIVRVVTFLILGILGYLFYRYDAHFPYKLEVVLTSMCFYAVGYYSKYLLQHYIVLIKNNLKILLLAASLLIINIISCYWNSERFDMCFNILGNIFLSYLSASAGILFVVVVSFFIDRVLSIKNPITITLIFLGQNSLIILGIHQLLKIILSILSAQFKPSIAVNLTKHFVFWLLLYFSIIIINKYLFFFLGKRRITTKLT